MYIKLASDYVHPRTHVPLPDAVLVISDVEFRMRAGDTRVTGAVYADVFAIQAAEPVEEFPISISIVERSLQLPAVLEALYTVIAAKDEYAGSTLVTP